MYVMDGRTAQLLVLGHQRLLPPPDVLGRRLELPLFRPELRLAPRHRLLTRGVLVWRVFTLGMGFMRGCESLV